MEDQANNEMTRARANETNETNEMMTPEEFFHDHPVIDKRPDGIYMYWTEPPPFPPKLKIICPPPDDDDSPEEEDE